MTRVSRLNVDVTASSDKLESGLALANARLDQFAKQGRKLGETFGRLTTAAGGLAEIHAIMRGFQAPFSVVGRYLDEVGDAADRAKRAIDEFHKSGRSFTSQGFSPAGAFESAQRLKDERFMAARNASFSATFAREALGPGTAATSYSEYFSEGGRFLAGFLGARSTGTWGAFGHIPTTIGLDAIFNPRELQSQIFAGLEASSRDDQEANYWAMKRAQGDVSRRQLLESMRKAEFSP